MFVLIVGAGRVGSTVARKALTEGHEVSVLDEDPLSHERLDANQASSWEDSGGRFTVGTALEIDALLEAGIEQADVFIASTDGDNTNIVIAQIAQRRFNMALLAVTIGIFVYLVIVPGSMPLFFTMVGLAFVFGLLLVMPIGSADMPVVMSLLNSYAGLASAATGFVLSNKVLIIAGTLDGFSGFILSILMCRAMNRSAFNVLFGAFGSAATAEGGGEQQGSMREVGLEDIATQLAYANKVIFVPGYGLATAQAQHAVRELAAWLRREEIDLVHAHMYRAEVLGTRAAVAAGTPVIMATVHSSRVRSPEDVATLAALTPAMDPLIVP